MQNQNPLILAVIDGNENIFTDTLLKQGQLGGRQAAQHITKGVAEYLSNEGVHVFGRLSFWVTVYLGQTQLLETLVAHNKCTAEQFEAFCTGFTQASPRFLVVNVGPGKEAVEVKVRGTQCYISPDIHSTASTEYLETYTRFPQTLRVFFAGRIHNYAKF